ncbi:NTP transferase domain-containing protein [Streptomyces radiopugnans]|uniref:Molybdopterin-guanine dinucleotide biosynthesis protein A n=1 Tax=Streptomyces radiopugnans TaxID=403935 RepID=A0A1H9CAA9_9ACTN|nr:NTP transferase domain-containing protein [Streptomyces radiopugnans]SEP98069.1 Molybdopterin-guanine dinucleotide biosynthesis protein A [Streptomyces radiopugnans]
MTDVYDAVVIAGGAARRLGGTDKPALTVGGRTLLDRVLYVCADAARTVVVGPRRPTARPVDWTREEPPGGGPLAALDAGLRRVGSETVLVLSADLPFLTPATVRALLDAVHGAYGTDTGPGGSHGPGGPDGAIVDDGRAQPLLGAYRTESLRRELALLAAEHGRPANLPLRLLTDELVLRRVAPAGPEEARDCDTWEELASARSHIREHGRVLNEWMTAAKAELGIDLDVDTAALLDLARDAAHGVARPAAPLTTFLVGYAAARAGGSPADVAETARKAAELARRWAEETAGTAENGKAGGSGEAGGGEGTDAG